MATLVLYFANSFDRLRDDADHERAEGPDSDIDEKARRLEDSGYDAFKSERLQRIMEAR